jgi:1-acyl-sn-glycerol-3-phosphate acyltransferase
MTALRSLLAWILMWVTLIIMAPPYVLGCLFDRGGRRMYWVQVLYLRFCLLYVGVKLVVEGREKLVSTQPTILMPNHRSYFDIPAIQVSIFPHQVRFVAKRDLAKIPFLGQAIRYGGHILIERDNREKAIRTLKEFAQSFSGGFSIVVFPEGTRSPDQNLLRFKRGGFYLAREIGARILPVSISGSQRILGKRGLSLNSGTIRLTIHDAIDPVDYPTNDGLIAAVRERIASGLDRKPAETTVRPLTAAGT